MDAAGVPGEVPQLVGLVRQAGCEFMLEGRPTRRCVYSSIAFAGGVYESIIIRPQAFIGRTFLTLEIKPSA